MKRSFFPVLLTFLFIFALPLHAVASGPDASSETANQIAVPERDSSSGNFEMLAVYNIRPLGTQGSGGPTGSGVRGNAPPGFMGHWEFGRVLPQFQPLCTLVLTNFKAHSSRYVDYTDRFVINGCHPNESAWKFDGTELIFYTNTGVISSRFRKNPAQNRWEGPFVLEPRAGVTHYVRFISTWEPSTNRPFGDYRNFFLGPEFCQDACDRETTCRAWTYSIPAAPGELPRCWLKSSVTAARLEVNCISGVKGGP